MTDANSIPAALRAHLELTYTLERPLGAGGMGLVWLARDRMLDRLVAIKVIRADAADDADSWNRFLQEARVAARLQHPGVVGLLTFGEIEKTRFFVMPFIEGETLAARLARGPLSEPEARRILTEVADALAHVHAQGVVHRDVKPANILIDRSGAARLADFGIAKTGSTTATSTGMIVGTPAYLSPEQVAGDGRPIDGRADLYALGVVAYEMVAGTLPFTATSPLELIGQHLAEAPPPLAARVPGVSEGFAMTVMRCLAKDRDARWASADDLVRALRLPDDGDPDPKALRPLRGVLSNALVLSAVLATWGAIPLSAFIPGDAPLDLRLVLMIMLVATPLAAAVFRFVDVRRLEAASGVSWSDILRLALRPPSWWPHWWPKRWRSSLERLHDLPPRLRSVMRWWSVALGAMSIAFGLIGVLLSLAATAQSDRFEYVFPRLWWALTNFIVPGTMWAVVGTAAVFGVSLFRARSFFRKPYERASRLIFGAPRAPDTWLDDGVRRLLADSPAAEREPATLGELAAQVLALRNELVAAGWSLDSFDTMISAARDARERWEKESQELSADVEPAETTRLRAKLRALDDAPSPTADQVELRDLLRRQLELRERQIGRLEEVNAALERLRAGLQLLWRQLRALRADDARRANAVEITGRVRALAEDIARLDSESRETERI